MSVVDWEIKNPGCKHCMWLRAEKLNWFKRILLLIFTRINVGIRYFCEHPSNVVFTNGWYEIDLSTDVSKTYFNSPSVRNLTRECEDFEKRVEG